MIKELTLTNWKSFEQATLYIDPLTIITGSPAARQSAGHRRGGQRVASFPGPCADSDAQDPGQGTRYRCGRHHP